MRFALALLCAGGVSFLLWFLAALMLDAKTSTQAAKVYFARFTPSKRRSELIVIPPGDQTCDVRSEPGRRMAS